MQLVDKCARGRGEEEATNPPQLRQAEMTKRSADKIFGAMRFGHNMSRLTTLTEQEPSGK